MSDALRLRPRGGAPAQVAQAYGVVQARAGQENTGVSPAEAKQAAQQAKRRVARLGGAANWALWLGAVALLGGGTVLGSVLGGGPQVSATATIQVPRLVNVVQPANAVAKAPVATHPEPHVILPADWAPVAQSAAAEMRPALAPPPPPVQAMPAVAPMPAVVASAEPAQPLPPATDLPNLAVMATKLAPMQKLVEPAAAAPVMAKQDGPAKPAAPALRTAMAQPALMLPPQTSGDERWRQLAQPAPADAKPPFIAIVIDDMGLDRRNSARAVNIAGPLTLSYMSYANELSEQSAAARAKGHEIMLHLPMEPLDAKRNDPGPNALYVGMDEAELRRRLTWALGRFDDYAGVNNHMGSRFTADARGMAVVLEELQKRGRFWLDSHTGPRSAGLPLAAQRGLAATGRDLFLDDERQAGGVAVQLAALERIARSNGDAIGIGHP
ncbi:divergent polysaccharide deacetylase family protein, partial [Ferrovibrio sp.]|uniref:divergent polysaccharide deacetylase family protein n=1 Tax=Ferrovibrio sp. TaxID=1917215 RepID=UPI001B4061DA